MSLRLAVIMLFLSDWVRGTLPATLGAVNGQGGHAFPCQRARGDTVRRALAVVLKTGDTTASFTYRVLYTDADGDAPLGGAPCLHILEHGGEINGSPFIMTFERGPYSGSSPQPQALEVS